MLHNGLFSKGAFILGVLNLKVCFIQSQIYKLIFKILVVAAGVLRLMVSQVPEFHIIVC